MARPSNPLKRFREELVQLRDKSRKKRKVDIGMPTEVRTSIDDITKYKMIKDENDKAIDKIHSLQLQIEQTHDESAQRGFQIQLDSLEPQQIKLKEALDNQQAKLQAPINQLESEITALIERKRLTANVYSDDAKRGLDLEIERKRQELTQLEIHYDQSKIVYEQNTRARANWDKSPIGYQVARTPARPAEAIGQAPQVAEHSRITEQDYLTEYNKVLENLEVIREMLEDKEENFGLDVAPGDTMIELDNLYQAIATVEEARRDIIRLEQEKQSLEQVMQSLGISIPGAQEAQLLDEVLNDAQGPEVDVNSVIDKLIKDTEASVWKAADANLSEDAQLRSMEAPNDWGEILQATAPNLDEEDFRDIPEDPFAQGFTESKLHEEAALPPDALPATPALDELIQPKVAQPAPPQERVRFDKQFEQTIGAFERIALSDARTNPNWEADRASVQQGKDYMVELRQLMATGDLMNNDEQRNKFITTFKNFENYINNLENGAYLSPMVEFRDIVEEAVVENKIPIGNTIENRKLFGSQANYRDDVISRDDAYEMVIQELKDKRQEMRHEMRLSQEMDRLLGTLIVNIESVTFSAISNTNQISEQHKEYEIADINIAAANTLIRALSQDNPDINKALSQVKEILNEINLNYGDEFEVYKQDVKGIVETANQQIHAAVSPEQSPLVDEAVCVELQAQAQQLIDECQDMAQKSQKTREIYNKGFILNPSINRDAYKQDKLGIVSELQAATQQFKAKADTLSLTQQDVEAYKSSIQQLTEKNQHLDKLTSQKDTRSKVERVLDKGKDMANYALNSLKEKISAKVKNR